MSSATLVRRRVTQAQVLAREVRRRTLRRGRRLRLRDPAVSLDVDPDRVDVDVGARLAGDALTQDCVLLTQAVRLEPVPFPQLGGYFLVRRAADEEVRQLHHEGNQVETDEKPEHEEDVSLDLRVLPLDRRKGLGPREQVLVVRDRIDTRAGLGRLAPLPAVDLRLEDSAPLGVDGSGAGEGGARDVRLARGCA
jgi:hypothetical protein